MIKGSIHQEDITITNIYARNIGAHKCIEETLTNMKGVIENNTIVVSIATMHKSSRQKVNKETKDLNNTIKKDLKDIY